MESLPLELVQFIAAAGAPVVFLICRRFAALLPCPHIKYDIMIAIGYDISITSHGIQWTKHGLFHRLDGPALEHCCSSDRDIYGSYKIWFRHGQRHREGGPAYISDRVMIWYKDGYRHRDDGPAEMYVNGAARYYLMGTHYRIHEIEIMAAVRSVTKKILAWFT